jgi:hypothetical protein
MLDFAGMITAVLAANLVTVGFVAACVYAERNPGFSQPWIVWAGLLMPLVAVILGFISTGSLPTR